MEVKQVQKHSCDAEKQWCSCRKRRRLKVDIHLSTPHDRVGTRVLNLLVTLPASNLLVIYRKVTGKLR